MYSPAVTLAAGPQCNDLAACQRLQTLPGRPTSSRMVETRRWASHTGIKHKLGREYVRPILFVLTEPTGCLQQLLKHALAIRTHHTSPTAGCHCQHLHAHAHPCNTHHVTTTRTDQPWPNTCRAWRHCCAMPSRQTSMYGRSRTAAFSR